MAKALTVLAVERAKPDLQRRLEIPDGGLPGLYLVVQPSGAKSWALRYRYAGKTRKMTLGAFPGIGLVAARDLASGAIRTNAEGRDPGGEKSEARQGEDLGRDLIENVATEFLTRFVRREYRASSAKQCQRLFDKEIVPVWSGRRVQDITKRDVLDLLDGIVDRGVGLTANRTFGAVRRFFNWCIDRDIVTASPCATVRMPFTEKSRDRVLTDDELRWLWKAADASGFPFGPITQLLLLTGQRREEVRGMREAEINLAEALWTLPGERTKNGRAHAVPLNAEAVEILTAIPKVKNRAGLIFTTNGATAVSGFSRDKARLDKAMLATARQEASDRGADPDKVSIAPWVLHDLRRTVASGLARLGIELPVIERVLNHVSGSFAGIVGVYQRHQFGPEMRKALDAWGRHVAALVEGKPEAKVVTMTRRGA
jgi:integrase